MDPNGQKPTQKEPKMNQNNLLKDQNLVKKWTETDQKRTKTAKKVPNTDQCINDSSIVIDY